MSRTILWSPNALAHLREICDYIAADSPQAALAVHKAVEATVGKLSQPSPFLAALDVFQARGN